MKELALRSLLFVPGDNEKMINKALASKADAVIVDLEDAVVPENKLKAREVSSAVLSSRDHSAKPVFVRVNAFDTDHTAHDLASAMSAFPTGIMLPKCQDMGEVVRLSHNLDTLEARDGIEVGSTRVLTVATETAEATLNLSSPQRDVTGRLWGMLWGSEDLKATLGSQSNRDEEGRYTFPYQFARTQCLYAASALGVVAIDSGYTDFRDLEGLAEETRLGLRDGFTAKIAIHPAQVEVINEIMTPTEEQLKWAEQVVEVLKDQAVARIDGGMVDLAHKRVAEGLLARHAAFSR